MSFSGLAGFRTKAANGARIGRAAVTLTAVLSTPSAAQPNSVRWVSGYYAAYSEFSANMPPSEFDYTAPTHLIQWPVVPRSDGTFDPNVFGMTQAQSIEVVSRAHAVGTNVGGRPASATMTTVIRDSVLARRAAPTASLWTPGRRAVACRSAVSRG